MSLFEKWEEIARKQMEPGSKKKYWEEYFLKEKEVYEDLLSNKEFTVNSTVEDFSKKYNMSHEWVMGFLDGIHTSLETPLVLESITEESPFTLTIDLEKLYFNMHKAEAEWLYQLPQWDEVLPLERRAEIEKEYRKSKTFVKEIQVGRNDPCICGSGKKYKKCCGA